MTVDIRIADTDEVKAAIKDAVDSLLLENHRLTDLVAAADRHIAELRAGLREALVLLEAYIDTRSDVLCAVIATGATTEDIAAGKVQILEHAGRVDELAKLVGP